MLGDGATQDDEVSRARAGRRDVLSVRYRPDAARRDEATIGLASIDHLGVTSDEENIRPLRGGAHRFRDARELRKWKSLLQDEGRAQVQGTGPCHSEVVDRAVDRQYPDVA